MKHERGQKQGKKAGRQAGKKGRMKSDEQRQDKEKKE